MKLLLAFILLLVVLGTYCKASSTSEPELVIVKENRHYIIYCIEGYKWIKFSGYTPNQMFEKHTNSYNPDINMLPVSCK